MIYNGCPKTPRKLHGFRSINTGVSKSIFNLSKKISFWSPKKPMNKSHLIHFFGFGFGFGFVVG
jgi:hypothetical protein